MFQECQKAIALSVNIRSIQLGCIDLILTNNAMAFQNTTTVSTDLSQIGFHSVKN